MPFDTSVFDRLNDWSVCWNQLCVDLQKCQQHRYWHIFWWEDCKVCCSNILYGNNLRYFLISWLATDGDIMCDSFHATAVNNFYCYGVDKASEMLLRNSCCRRVYFKTNIYFRFENVAHGFHSHLIVSFSNTLRPRQDSHHFADDIFKCIFLNDNVWISITIYLKFVLNVPIDNKLSLAAAMRQSHYLNQW